MNRISTGSACASTVFGVFSETRERDRDGDTVQDQPEDALQVAEAIRRDVGKLNGSEP